MIEIEVKWRKVERLPNGGVLDPSTEAGVYIFLYNGYPFYVGTAGVNNFGARMLKHAALFKAGKRTFLKDSYFKSFQPWTKGLLDLDKTSFFEYVYVPEVSKSYSENESLSFWMGLEIYHGAMGSSDKKAITTLEKTIQLFLIDQNSTDENIEKLYIPNTSSTFFGRQEPGNFMLDYQFKHYTQEIAGSYLEELLSLKT